MMDNRNDIDEELLHNETLKYFDGEEMPTKVWINKYRQKDELTPDDRFSVIAKEFAEMQTKTLINSFWSENNTAIELTEKKDLSGLSKYGSNKFSELFNIYCNKGGKEAVREHLENHYKNLFGKFEHSIGGGSVLQGIGANNYSSLSNCFVMGQPFDSYVGIIEKENEVINTMKRRGGNGLDVSTLRPRYAPIHNQAGYSTGPMLFVERYEHGTREVAQDARRGALMITMNILHPDSMDFITAKQVDGKLSGCNMSLQIPNEFMEAVENNQEIYLRFPCDIPVTSFLIQPDKTYELNKLYSIQYIDKDFNYETGFIRKVSAKEYWNKLIYCAWFMAEPGLMFMDNHNDYAPDSVYPKYKGVTSNPCGEIRMQPYDSCRLIAENMLVCVDNPYTKEAKFNIEKWYKSCYEQQCSADTLVDLEAKYVQKIIDKISLSNDPEEYKQIELNLWRKIKETCLSSRRTGSGFLALGDTLAALNLPYSTKNNETKELLEKIFKTKMEAELDATIDLAIIYEPFNGWKADNEYQQSIDSQKIFGTNKFYQFLLDEFPEQTNRMMKYGRRNVSWSTAAPTGSLSILTRTTSGIEPLFLPFYKRRVKCINEHQRVDFIDTDGQKFTEYINLHYQFKQWIKINHPEVDVNNLTSDETQKLFEESPWFGSCAGDIDYNDRIAIQAIVQKYTSHSISSTLNLSNDTKQETVEDIYMKSWKTGLKGQTVYRDGCRKGVIVSADKIEQTQNEFKDVRAPKRPITLKADYYNIFDKKKTYSILVGLMNNRPYEIFIISEISGLPEILDNDKISGTITKEMKDVYSFEADTYDFIIPNLQDAENVEKSLGLDLSMALRHGVPLKFVVKNLNKRKPIAGSFTHKLIKILSKYIPNGEETGEKCPDCGEKIRYENGCKICSNPDCGYSAC